MTSRLSCLLLVLFGGTAMAAPEPLEAYSWLVGVWTAHGSTPEKGEFTEEFAYEWTMNRKFMKTTYVMRAGETIVWTDVGMVGVDPQSGHLIGFNFGMDGTIGWARTTEEESVESYIMEGSVVGPSPIKDFRVRMKRIGEDGMEFTIEAKEGEAYVQQSTQTYRRKGTAEMAPCPEPDASDTPAALTGLEPLVGGWRGSASGDRGGSIETTFEWRLNRTFLRRAQVATDAAGATRETVTWIGWDPQRKSVVAFSFEADGSVSLATATVTDGPQVVEEAEGGAARTSYRLDGEGRLALSIEKGKDGAFAASLERK